MLDKIKKIQELATELKEQLEKKDLPLSYYEEQGRKGGEIIKQRLLKDPDYYRRMGLKSAEVRRKKKLSP